MGQLLGPLVLTDALSDYRPAFFVIRFSCTIRRSGRMNLRPPVKSDEDSEVENAKLSFRVKLARFTNTASIVFLTKSSADKSW